MLISLILLSYPVIYGLRIIGISFIASVSWSSAILMSGSLQQNIIGATINEWRKQLIAGVHAGGHFNSYSELLMKLKPS